MKIIPSIFLISGKALEKSAAMMDFFHSRYAKAYLLYKKAHFSDDILFVGKPKLHIGISTHISIGKQFVCRSGRVTKLDNGAYSTLHLADGATLSIGDFSGMTNGIIVCEEKITIGDHVNIGNGTIIMDTDLHSLDWRVRSDRALDHHESLTRPVTIGNHVFVGARVIILKGVSIGEKSIVAAGSVVTRSIPAGEIWGGNPARFIRAIDQ